ncbi:binding-protein-dependent transport systems inner membrane component (plasmid) [Rhizobium leguminosarum bv. trifolii WSM2304]|uniref:Binding-protein-dependent transport systems inner membrane component n=1 Tax=Rhizobium leguminosarum bv. trifolii (strain WSM2304) TaxID=395492 RepID=A0ABF7QW00_RHILW|nr:ABC transporter permease [Rhizobium leguminosarum]ACI58229.1 binding-protein-dependent transport systems inner membrane component [Rhizobium leguminosarum bv. trifolii WSM2304]
MAKIRKKFLLSMQAEISPATYLVISVCSFAIFFVVWAVVVQAGLVRPIFLPSPVAIVTRLWALGVEGTLFSDIAASVYRIGVGFLVASISALAVGVLIGNYRFWNAAIEPFLDFIRYMPVVAFVPLTILWAGTTDTQKFLVIWIGTFFQQALMFMDNIKRVPPDFIGFGRTVGLSDAKIVTRIILPSAAPQIWDTLRISLGWAWTWVVLAELVAASSGLGYRINVAQRYFQTDTAIGYIVVLGVLGLISDQIMKFVGKRMFRYEAKH